MPDSPQEPDARSVHSSRYKFQRLRERLRQAIEGGELSGKLPGERELARKFDANAKTINKALSDLTAEGVLVRYVGRGTFVLGADGGGDGWSGKSLKIGFWAEDFNEGALRTLVADQLSAKGHRLEPLSADDAVGEGEAAVLKPIRLRELDGIVFCACPPGTAMLGDLHRRHVPVVLACTCHQSIKMPSVVIDYAQGTFELAQHLLHFGHRRILLAISPELNRFASAAVAGYQAAMRRHNIEPEEAIQLDGPLDRARLRVGNQPATAVIFAGAAATLESVRVLRAAGMTIPDTLSVTAVDHPCAPELRSSSITAYETDPAGVAHWVVDALVGWAPGAAPRTVTVPGQIHCRSSVMPREQAAPLPPPREAVLEA